MRAAIFSLGLFGLIACSSEVKDLESAFPKLTTYEASEFEPNWSLKLLDEKTLEFTQLDPVAGNSVVTYRYTIIKQLEDPSNWNLRGSGENGDITLWIRRDLACTHSGLGYIHRDTVVVTTDAQIWRGCGGPILEEG